MSKDLSRRGLFGAPAIAALPVPAKPAWEPPKGAIPTIGQWNELTGWRVARPQHIGGSYEFGGRSLSTFYDFYDLDGKRLG
jgi:hypothetical protein